VLGLERGMSWPQMLLWGVLGLLLIESFLFHRKAVY
jgi:integral membrane sensor domain MASE1